MTLRAFAGVCQCCGTDDLRHRNYYDVFFKQGLIHLVTDCYCVRASNTRIVYPNNSLCTSGWTSQRSLPEGGYGPKHAAHAQVDYNGTDKCVYDGVFAACIEKKVSYG